MFLKIFKWNPANCMKCIYINCLNMNIVRRDFIPCKQMPCDLTLPFSFESINFINVNFFYNCKISHRANSFMFGIYLP